LYPCALSGDNRFQSLDRRLQFVIDDEIVVLRVLVNLATGDGEPPREVALNGEAFLSVTISPAASVDVSTEDHKRTYFGNLLLQYGEHHHLVLVRKFVDVLGAVRWVIALDAERPFLVDSAVDPTRITVYIG